ncbi:MAG: ATP-dependent DNA ligase [Quisquiliibacterium sp.]
MWAFAELFGRLDASTSTRDKTDALVDYLRDAPHEDAAWAVYFLAGGKPRQLVPSRLLREAAMQACAMPEWLFEESYQAVGDLAETIALLLPQSNACSRLGLGAWMQDRLLALRKQSPEQAQALLRQYWSELDGAGRLLMNKLITGGFRVGVSRQLVARALAQLAGVDDKLLAQRMIGYLRASALPDAQAYRALVAPQGAGADADAARALLPLPFFLAHPLQQPCESLGDPQGWLAEWKWDGIRVQLVCGADGHALWSRGEELLTDRFPELGSLAAALPADALLDGELLCWDSERSRPMPFASLQRRIGRRTVSPKLQREAPVRLIAYDLLRLDGCDLRDRPLSERRSLLERIVREAADPHLTLSQALPFEDWSALQPMRAGSRERGVEGLMLKRVDSAYGVGRTRAHPAGDWWKWKLDPLTVDAVLIYAQRGHGRRASLYTDYTFALWDRGPEPDPGGKPADGAARLVPFAKAYSGLTDAQIREVDAVIRRTVIDKFGPVRSVEPTLVFELAFEAIQRSPRHRSGVAVRFPRIVRPRPDKAVEQADSLQSLLEMLG